MRLPRGFFRSHRRAGRLSALVLLCGFQVFSLAALLLDSEPVGGSGRSALTRRDPSGADRTPEHEQDKACVARKAMSEQVVAGERRSQPSPERRRPVALEPLIAAAQVSRDSSGSALTHPAPLLIFLPANPQSLRAPPARA